MTVAPGSNKSAWMVFKSKDFTLFTKRRVIMSVIKTAFTSKWGQYVYAHIVSILPKFTEWFKKQNHGVNGTAIAQAGLPLSSVGKKGGKRKGVSKNTSQKKKKRCMKTFRKNKRRTIPNTTDQWLLSVIIKISASKYKYFSNSSPTSGRVNYNASFKQYCKSQYHSSKLSNYSITNYF